MELQVVLVEGLPMKFWTKSRTKYFLRDSRCTKETVCFPIHTPFANLHDLHLLCDGCKTVLYVVGSFSDHARIGSAFEMGFYLGFVHCGRQNSIVICNFRIVRTLYMGFHLCFVHCGRQNSIVICNCRIVLNGIAVVLVDNLWMKFHCGLCL